MIGERLGSYEILSEIGRGGMGTVYRARQAGLERIVALKVLPGKLAGNREFVVRFMREARSIATLEHPGIVTVYDVGESDGTYYFAMQLLEGSPLSGLIEQRGPLPTEEAASIAAQVAEALGFAHAAGILHRDVKPDNIVVDSNGRAILTDFGIAWSAADTRLTQAGNTVGSPQYMSPEQIAGKKVDQRADLYSLGVVFFQMITGEAPFKGDSAVSVAYQHVRAPVPAANAINAEVPSEAGRLAARLMAKQPETRHANAGELAKDLWVLAGGRPAEAHGPMVFEHEPSESERRRRVLLVAVAAVTTALLIVIGLILRSGSSSEETAADVAASGAETSAATAVVDTPAPSPLTPPSDQQVAVPPPLIPFLIGSEPAGATVRLDGAPLAEPTPVVVELDADRAYTLELELSGYEAVRRSLRLSELADRSANELVLGLQKIIPPGRLRISASYPVEVRLDGRTYPVSGGVAELPPGRHRVTVSAPSVFYSTSRQIEIRSGGTSEISLPAATRINIAAAPSRCRLRIDGRDAGDLPTEVRVTLGRHEFEFIWQGLDKSTTLTRQITPRTDRIFAAAP